MDKFTKADFVIDSLPGTVFPGYTDGDDWNGWACPYFERDEAERVLRGSQSNGFTWQYDGDNDAYIVTGGPAEESEPEVFEGKIIAVSGIQKKVYPGPAGAFEQKPTLTRVNAVSNTGFSLRQFWPPLKE